VGEVADAVRKEEERREKKKKKKIFEFSI